MDWYWWILVSVAINWVGCLALGWTYCGILILSGDLRIEGWLFWGGWWPVARTRLISKKSWFARAWQKWYGQSWLGVIIHRDEKGSYDDSFVELTIVHEMRHNLQQLILGLVFYVIYGIDFLRLSIIGKSGYNDNWAEVDARKRAKRWVDEGRPPMYDFGKRR